MAQQTIIMHFDFNKPLEQVFAQLSDHEFFGKTCGINMKRIQDGSDSENGLGSVRKISIGLLPSFEETITKFVPNEHIEYKITKGSPIKNHVGTLDFKDTDKGCSLDYVIKLESKIPLTTGIIASGLEGGITKGMRRYAKA